MRWVDWCFTSHATIFQSYMWRHRCADRLKKKLYLRSGSQRHRHFAGFFNVPVLHRHGTNLFIRWFWHTAPLVAFYHSKVSTKYNDIMLRIIWWVLSHYKEGISHHFQNLNVGALLDKIYVAEWFRAQSPSSVRCKEGHLPLLNFSNLTCMLLIEGIMYVSKTFSTRKLDPLTVY